MSAAGRKRSPTSFGVSLMHPPQYERGPGSFRTPDWIRSLTTHRRASRRKDRKTKPTANETIVEGSGTGLKVSDDK